MDRLGLSIPLKWSSGITPNWTCDACTCATTVDFMISVREIGEGETASGSYWGAAQVSKGSSSTIHPSVMIYGPLPQQPGR